MNWLGFGITIVIVFSWAFLASVAQGWLPKDVGKWAKRQIRYYRSPEGRMTARIAAVGAGLLVFGVLGLLVDLPQWWEDLSAEAVGLGGTALFLDYLTRG